MPSRRTSENTPTTHSGEQATDAHCNATGLAPQYDGHRYPSPKGEITIPTRQHQQIVERWFEDLFTRADLSAVDELVSADFVAYGTGGDGQSIQTRGPDAFREWLRWYISSFTDREWTVHDVISEGDKVVARYSGWATYRGGLLEIPSAGQRVRESGILIYRIEGGKVAAIWSEMSDLQVVMQLGAFSVPGRREE
jgi:predicted ester cyclase